VSDDVGEMAVFVRVVRDGSFSAAARQLGLTPSAVSKRLSRLEDRLGARLLNRTTRSLGLTEVGEAFHERCLRILADVEEAEGAVTKLHAAPRGTLRVSASIAFGQRQIVPLIPEFLGRYTDLRVELTMTDRLIDLVDEGVDVAVRVSSPPDSSMIARKLAPERRIVCAAPSYLERFGAPRTPDDLADHNCLTYSTLSADEWHFSGVRRARAVAAQGNFAANGGEAMREVALAGLGLVRLAAFLIGPDIRAGRLKPLLEKFERPQDSAIYAVYPHRQHLSPKVRAFVDFLVEKMTPVPPWEYARAGG
jgi:DNA-binding transcriptional LysR family regulator